MPVIVLLATAWGYKAGGINTFNREISHGLAEAMTARGRVFCVVPSATPQEIASAREVGIELVSLESDEEEVPGRFDPGWIDRVKNKIAEREVNHIDLCLGHDVVSGRAANRLRDEDRSKRSKSAVIMHMSYIDYQGIKHDSSQEAQRKHDEQRSILEKADFVFGVGPLLRDRARDIVPSSEMLVPGLSTISPRPPSSRLVGLSFGRYEAKNDKIKQVRLAVEGMAEACRKGAEVGMPPLLRDNPLIKLIGVSENKDEDVAVRTVANEVAGRLIDVLALPYEEERSKLLRHVSESTLSMMLSWHEGFGLTGWEAIAAEVPLIISEQTGLYRLLKEDSLDPFVWPVLVEGSVGGGENKNNFTTGDKERVANSIIKIVSDLPNATKKAKRLKAALVGENYTWRSCAEKLLSKAFPEGPPSSGGFTPSPSQAVPHEVGPQPTEPVPPPTSAEEPISSETNSGTKDGFGVELRVDSSVGSLKIRFSATIGFQVRTINLSSHHKVIRERERVALQNHLKTSGMAWLVADWGMGKSEFLATCSNLEGISQSQIVFVKYRDIEAKEEKNLHYDLKEEWDLLKGKLIVIDQIPQIYDTTTSTIVQCEKIAKIIRDSVPEVSVVIASRFTPWGHALPVVELEALDEIECRRYVVAHPNVEANVASRKYLDRLYAKSEGIPVYLDRILQAIKNTSIDSVLNDIDEDIGFVFASATDEEREFFSESIRQNVEFLKSSSDKYQNRSVKLFKSLILLSAGEVFEEVKRLDGKAPFFPRNVEDLSRLGLIRNISVSDVSDVQENSIKRISSSAKIIRVPRQIRDYAKLEIFRKQDLRETAVSIVEFFFGPKWSQSEPTVEWLKPTKSGNPSFTKPENRLVILPWLLRDSADVKNKTRFKQLIVLIKCCLGALRTSDMYRDTYIFAIEIIRLLDSLGHQAEADELCYTAGDSLRMLGLHEEARDFIFRSLRYYESIKSKKWLAKTYVDLAYISEKCGTPSETIDWADQAISILGEDSEQGFSAREIKIFSDGSTTWEMKAKMWYELEAKARKKKYLSVADNIALRLAQHVKDPAERIRIRSRVLEHSKTGYNAARATIANANDRISLGLVSEISYVERSQLGTAYSYVHHQRLGDLFLKCHDALWEVRKSENGVYNLMMLAILHTAFRSLYSDDEKETRYVNEFDRIAPSEGIREKIKNRLVSFVGGFIHWRLPK